MLVKFVASKDLSKGVPRYTVLQVAEDGNNVYMAVHENVTFDTLPTVVRLTEEDFSRRAGRDLFVEQKP